MGERKTLAEESKNRTGTRQQDIKFIWTNGPYRAQTCCLPLIQTIRASPQEVKL